MEYIVIGFIDNTTEGEAVIVRPFLRSNDTGHIHYAENNDELQERLETLGDLTKYEKVIFQEANKSVGPA